MTLREAEMFLSGKLLPKTQIEKELAWALKYYEGIEPAMFVSYERDSYGGIQDSTLRITFDSNPLIREERLSLADGIWGEKFFRTGFILWKLKHHLQCHFGLQMSWIDLKFFRRHFLSMVRDT